jgi:phenylacetate-CoA ligase
MLIVRGVNVYPSTIEELVRRFAAAAEYRVIVDQRSVMTEIYLEIELESDGNATNIMNYIQQAIATSMTIRCEIRSVPVGSLPRHEMKARRWTSLKYEQLQ